MGILQLPTPLVGQGGLLPISKKMVSSDNLTTVTTAGYLNNVNLEGYPITNGDVIEMFYNFNQVTGVGTYANFTVSITNGVITLVEAIPPGGVTVIGTPTAGHIAEWASSTSLEDGGVLGTAANKAASDATKASVASISLTPVVVGNIANFADTAGTIEDSNVPITSVQLKANIKAANLLSGIGGTGVSYTVSVPGLLSTSIVVANLRVAGTDATAAVNAVVAAPDEFLITFTADPGAGSELSYIAFIAPQ